MYMAAVIPEVTYITTAISAENICAGMLHVQGQNGCCRIKGRRMLTCLRHDMAFTLALLGYTMMESSRDTPTPMQMPLILLMHTCKAPASHHELLTCNAVYVNLNTCQQPGSVVCETLRAIA